jgi:hypothetical protein
MARYTGAVCRICRREGMKLFLKGIDVIQISVQSLEEIMHQDNTVLLRRSYPTMDYN